MKHALPFALMLVFASPALAENQTPNDLSPNFGEGANQLFGDLLNDLAPLFEGMEELGNDLGEEIGPLLDDLNSSIAEGFEGLNAYHPPEFLPNGDIIIRRKQPGETAPTPEDPIDI